MNTYVTIFGVAAIAASMFVFLGVWVSRYVKVSPNQALIVSGRKFQLPDGRTIGFRIVKNRGTFVFPLVERADVLSLEARTIGMPRAKARITGGTAVEVDCVSQVKIKSDDDSILSAAEYFLNKTESEFENIVRPVLEKHLSAVLKNSSLQEISEDPGACASRMQTAAAGDLSGLGLSLISFTIRNAHAS